MRRPWKMLPSNAAYAALASDASMNWTSAMPLDFRVTLQQRVRSSPKLLNCLRTEKIVCQPFKSIWVSGHASGQFLADIHKFKTAAARQHVTFMASALYLCDAEGQSGTKALSSCAQMLRCFAGCQYRLQHTCQDPRD